VYTLPSMQLLVDSEGQKKSITVDGITDWEWCPNRNLVVFTSFSKTAEGSTQIDPKVGFLKIPERKVVSLKSMKNSESLKLVMHPQGFYLAIINEYLTKKSKQFSVELFDLNDTRSDLFPQQQIFIRRVVFDFNGVFWEPNHHRLAVHTNSKREMEAGKREYTVDAKRNGVDIYEMSQHP